MNRLRAKFITLASLVLMTLTSSAVASEQKLINPGERWDDVARKAKPGDRIVLMPGEHRPGKIMDHGGTIDQPIIIGGIDAEHMVTIKGDRFGLLLTRPGHLVFKNMIIDGATVNGIFIDGTDKTPRAPGKNAPVAPVGEEGAEATGSVRFINVTILNIGQKTKKRNAIELLHTKHVTFDECHIENWSDVGVEIIGCDQVVFDSCTFQGKLGLSPVAGIRARAGSQNIDILNCRFSQCGLAGICAGGISKLKEFPAAQLENMKLASIFEARRMNIEKNVFVGGASALTLAHCDRVEIMRNTIVNPAYYVFCLLRISKDEHLGNTRRCTVGRNLVTWEPDSMQKFFLLDQGIEIKTLKLDSNLWWSAEPFESWERLGQIPQTGRVEQRFTIDPKLDELMNPTATQANGYGALPIRIVRPGDDNLANGR